MKTLSFKHSARICTIAVSIGLVLALAGANLALADESLDQLLTTAMENHPDIVAAKAKVALAEAELNATRLQVARQVIALWGERNTQRVAMEGNQRQLVSENIAPEKRSLLTNNLQETRVKLEQTEAEIKYLTAKETPVAPQSKDSPTPPRELQHPSGPLVEELAKEFRKKTITLNYVEAPIDQVILYMADYLKYPVYIDKRTLSEAGIDPTSTPITMNMRNTPLPAVLQALQDQNQGLEFVIRDYGILLTTIDQAKAQGYFPALDFAQ